jgi:hypothetical protein
MLGGLLDNDEKKYLSDKFYDDFKPFTPLLDSDRNWILPLYQIFENKNLDCWWVKYLPIVEFKSSHKS